MLAAGKLRMGAGTGSLDTQTLVSVSIGTVGDRIRGYLVSPAQGSLTPSTSAVYGGAAINGLYHQEDIATATLAIAGLQANSGWTQIKVGGTVLTRASASYSQSGGVTYWQWASALGGFAVGTKTVAWS